MSTKTEIRNARIESVKLCIEDHGILTFYITLELSGGGGCTLGGYALDKACRVDASDDRLEYERLSSPAGLECIRKIMEVVGVRSWEDLNGKYIRYEDCGLGRRITKIGNIMKDEYIDIDEFFKNYDYEKWIAKF